MCSADAACCGPDSCSDMIYPHPDGQRSSGVVGFCGGKAAAVEVLQEQLEQDDTDTPLPEPEQPLSCIAQYGTSASLSCVDTLFLLCETANADVQ